MMYPDPQKKMDNDIEVQEEQNPSGEDQDHERPGGETAGIRNGPKSVPEYVTPGKYLRTAREKAGLNRARVGQALGLTETAVKNLETNAFDLFPGNVYVRGYLKNYARLLGESEDELIAVFDRFCTDHQLDNGRSTPDLSSLPSIQVDRKKIIAVTIGLAMAAILAIVIISTLA